MNKKIMTQIGIILCSLNIASLLYAPAIGIKPDKSPKESTEAQKTEKEIAPPGGASIAEPSAEFDQKYPTLIAEPKGNRFFSAISFMPNLDLAPNQTWKNETVALLADLTQWFHQFKDRMIIFNELSQYVDDFQKRIISVKATKKGEINKIGTELNNFIFYNVKPAIGKLKEAINKVLPEALFMVENVEDVKKAKEETTDIPKKYSNLFQFDSWGKKLLALIMYNPVDDSTQNQKWSKDTKETFNEVIKWIDGQKIEITKFEELIRYLDDLQKKIGQLATESLSKPRTVKAAHSVGDSINSIATAKELAKDQLKKIIGLPVE